MLILSCISVSQTLNLIHLSCRWNPCIFFLSSFNKQDSYLTGVNADDCHENHFYILRHVILSVKIYKIKNHTDSILSLPFLSYLCNVQQDGLSLV